MTDLFGCEIVEKPKHGVKGYAAPPGTGPAGETCKTCKHFIRRKYRNKTFFKCRLRAIKHELPVEQQTMRNRFWYSWSHCEASDIRAGSPACQKWTMRDLVEWVQEPAH